MTQLDKARQEIECNTCHKLLEPSRFPKVGRKCKECQSEYGKAYRKNMSEYQKEYLKKYHKNYERKDKDRRNEYRRDYVKNNKERIKEIQRRSQKKYYKKNKYKICQYQREYQLRKVKKTRLRALSPCEVIYIFYLKSTGLQNKDIAAFFDCKQSFISHIITRRCFGKIPIPDEIITACTRVNNINRAKNSGLIIRKTHR